MVQGCESFKNASFSRGKNTLGVLLSRRAEYNLEQIPLDHAVSAGHIYTRWDRSRQLALLAEARVSQHITPPQGRNTSVRQIWVWGELPSLFLAISCHYRAS